MRWKRNSSKSYWIKKQIGSFSNHLSIYAITPWGRWKRNSSKSYWIKKQIGQFHIHLLNWFQIFDNHVLKDTYNFYILRQAFKWKENIDWNAVHHNIYKITIFIMISSHSLSIKKTPLSEYKSFIQNVIKKQKQV